MFRFIFFLFGITAGVITALLYAPMPGRTFFNRLSRLPRGLKSLIDDSLDLYGSCNKIFSNISEDLNSRITRAAKAAREESAKARESIEERLSEFKEDLSTKDSKEREKVK